MNNTPKKLVFELDAKQMILVLIGLGIVGVMVYKVGFIAGSRVTKAKMLQARLEEDPRRKIKAPSLLEETKPANEERESSAVEAILEKAAEEDKRNDGNEASKAKAETPSPPEKKVAAPKKKATSSKQKSAPPSAAVKKTKTTEARYYVQVASFSNAADARRRRAELEKKGYRVIIVKAQIPGKGTYHRVRLGPFSSISKAKSFALKFEKKENVSTFIPVD